MKCQLYRAGVGHVPKERAWAAGGGSHQCWCSQGGDCRPGPLAASSSGLTSEGLHVLKSWTFGSNLLFRSGWGGYGQRENTPDQAHPFSLLLFQGSAPILVAMVILLNIGVAILFINFFI